MSQNKKLLIVQIAALGNDFCKNNYGASLGNLQLHKTRSIFPAVTSTLQGTFRTASPPSEHGIISNGLYFRDQFSVSFWNQSSALVQGERIWEKFRSSGKSVGISFWQQSLGESADVIISPAPIHTHGGGMIMDCYSKPDSLYKEICSGISKNFKLRHYWGPLSSRKSTEWILSSLEYMLEKDRLPDLYLTYLPHLDYSLQKYGPDSPKSIKELNWLMQRLQDVLGKAEDTNVDVMLFGDYAMTTVTNGPVFPNRTLAEEGFLSTREIKHMLYPDFYRSSAFAMVDHEAAHVYVAEQDKIESVMDCLSGLQGVDEIIKPADTPNSSLSHQRSGELILKAEPGYWFAYPWWDNTKQAPDYASHIDIHNKPGFDPCELFFGWPPWNISLNPEKVKGTHGRTGPGREVVWGATCDLEETPANLQELSEQVEKYINRNG